MVKDFETKLDIKPFSVNQAWRGRRFRTPAYIKYTRDLLLILPNQKLPDPPFRIEFDFGFSNSASDWDNPIKPLQDILQKKYNFNDKEVFQGIVTKTKVSKGKEFIRIKISNYEK